jgi:hypothetical protein
MSTNALDQYLPIENDSLILEGDSLPGNALDRLLTAYNGGLPLTIDQAKKQSADSAVTVTGVAEFMEVPSLPVTAKFTQDGTGVVTATLRFELIGDTRGPNPWIFSKSFTDLPLFMDYTKSVTTPSLNQLDALSLTNSAYVLTTHEGRDDVTGAPLSAGLNFVGRLRPTGLLGLFSALMEGDKEVLIYGPIIMPLPAQTTPPLLDTRFPWQMEDDVPGIKLQADLGIELSISSLKLRDTTLRIYSPVSKKWQSDNPTYQATTAVTSTLDIPSASISVGLTALLIPGTSQVTLAGEFEGVTVKNLAQLTDLSNGSDLGNDLPPEIKSKLEVLENLALQEVGIAFSKGLSPSSIDYVYIAVGLPGVEWPIFTDITVKNVITYFFVNSPFNQGRSLSAIIGGQFDMSGALFKVSAEVPSFTVRADLLGDTTLPLKQLFTDQLPSLPPPPDLSVDALQLIIAPGTQYSFFARMAEDPSWVLDVGPTPMAISNVELDLSKQASGSAKGTFTGEIEFGDDLYLDMRYDTPGDFYIRAEFADVKLSQLIARLNEIGIELPQTFDLKFEETWVVIEKQGSGLAFTAATSVNDVGLVAFTAKKMPQWGFATGVDLNVPNLMAIPGLEALAPFQSFVGLDQLMLVVSSLEDPGFEFPSMANFNAPPLGNKNISLPPQASGLAQGMNIYARLNSTSSQAFQALASYLNVRLDGTVGVTLAVSLPNPATNSKLFISADQEIQKGTTLKGKVGGLLTGSQVGLFLTGTVKTTIQNQPVEFDVTALALSNGVLISGTMKGGPVHFDMIPAQLRGSDSLPVQLSNVALVIGISFQGIPSFGIAATIDAVRFNSSIALFIDTVNPAQSMFAGAVSNLTLADVAKTFAGQKDLPAPLGNVFAQVGLKGLKAFQMPAAIATALDNRDLVAIANAFQQYGGTQIPANSNSILLAINTPGSVWHLTDLTPTSMRHYGLSKQGDQVTVELQAQIYCVPQDTFIGSLQYRQGFEIEADITFLALHARIKAIIRVRQGIMADVDVAPMIIYNRDFFAITDASGGAGPRLSIASFDQPNHPDPNLRGPHFLLTGKLRLLGVDVSSTYISVTESGLVFQLKQQLTPLLYTEIKGSFTSLNNLSAGGAANVGIDRQLDLGQLGQVRVQTVVNGSLTLGYNGSSAFAKYKGGFDFQGLHGEVPETTLDVNGPALATIADTLWAPVSNFIKMALKSADQWLKWVRDNVIPGIGQNAEQVGKVLKAAFPVSPDDIASKTQQFLGYGSTQVAQALKGAGVSPDQVVQILQKMGCQAQEIVSIISNVFKGQRINFNFGHIDTPGGPHADSQVPPHLDNPNAHADIPTKHVDYGKWGAHVDQKTPGGSKRFHADTPGGPHADSQVPPHVDTGTHIDI